MTPSPTGSDLREANDFLDANPDIEAIDLILTDCNGIARGKIVRRHELAGIYNSGRHMPISILGLDIAGEDVHETGLIWDSGDGDLRAWPVPGSLKRLHGTNPARAEVLMTMHQLDGTPMGSDPRHALEAARARMAKAGFRAQAAFELEFFLLANERGPDGKPRPADAVVDGRASAKTEVYSVDHLHGMEPLASGIYAAARAMDIPVETLISEYAPGQYELTLHYRADVLQAADDLVRLKRIVRAEARRNGVTACFMAKPFSGVAGSGMHVHMSLCDQAGSNIFAAAGQGGTPYAASLLHAIGGLRQTMAESMLVFAPHANSWRRFVSQSYAPVAPTWGVNNRSVALRIPAGDIRARRIEHRLSGVDANPYLVAATVLEGMRLGLQNSIDPGPETTGNGYDVKADGAPLPGDWLSAIRLAEGSRFLADALGAQMHRTFCAIKKAEYLRVASTIPDVDFDLYLHTA